MKAVVTDTNGRELVSIKVISQKAKVSPSAIRGYEQLGLLRKYDVSVIRHGNNRYFYLEDYWKLSSIKIDRVSRRNQILASQGGKNANF